MLIFYQSATIYNFYGNLNAHNLYNHLKHEINNENKTHNILSYLSFYDNHFMKVVYQ